MIDEADLIATPTLPRGTTTSQTAKSIVQNSLATILIMTTLHTQSRSHLRETPIQISTLNTPHGQGGPKTITIRTSILETATTALTTKLIDDQGIPTARLSHSAAMVELNQGDLPDRAVLNIEIERGHHPTGILVGTPLPLDIETGRLPVDQVEQDLDDKIYPLSLVNWADVELIHETVDLWMSTM